MNRSRPTTTLRTLALLAACMALPGTAAASRLFSQPDEAAAALVDRLKAGDGKGAIAVLGQASREWVLTGDTPTDRALWQDFVAAYEAQHSVYEPRDGRAVLIIGSHRYPFPIPIVRVAGGWRFDPAQGKEEIINRRVGKNELSTIAVMQEIVAAQREYLLMDRSGNAVREYATRLASTPGTRDGLYWPTAEGEAPSPLGPLVAQAQAAGYTGHTAGQPFYGYRYKLLDGQGPAAAGGARPYTVNGQNTGGFAVLAYPARYGSTGVKSFIVNQEGVVYERDLGSKTAEAAARTTLFDPDAHWVPTSVR